MHSPDACAAGAGNDAVSSLAERMARVGCYLAGLPFSTGSLHRLELSLTQSCDKRRLLLRRSAGSNGSGVVANRDLFCLLSKFLRRARRSPES